MDPNERRSHQVCLVKEPVNTHFHSRYRGAWRHQRPVVFEESAGRTMCSCRKILDAVPVFLQHIWYFWTVWVDPISLNPRSVPPPPSSTSAAAAAGCRCGWCHTPSASRFLHRLPETKNKQTTTTNKEEQFSTWWIFVHRSRSFAFRAWLLIWSLWYEFNSSFSARTLLTSKFPIEEWCQE